MEASTEKYQQANLDPLSGIISNIIGLVNSGTITMELDRQPLLRLKINQNDIYARYFLFSSSHIFLLIDPYYLPTSIFLVAIIIS
jgi:hypothetical protein